MTRKELEVIIRKHTSKEPADLEGANLEDVDIVGANLKGANLKNSIR